MPLHRRYFPDVQLHRPRADLLTLLCVSMVLIQIWLAWLGGVESVHTQDYYLALGLSWEGVSHVRVWQFFTHALTHAGWSHLLVNLLMLWLVGGRVIHILGQKRFTTILVSGVITGGVLHLLTDFWLTRAGFPGTQLVGISGACFALLLTLTTLSPESRMWPFPVSGKNLGLGVMSTELLLWLMTPGLNLPGFSTLGQIITAYGGGAMFQISHACHFGGAVTGWLLARRLLAPCPSLADLQSARAQQETQILTFDGEE